MGLPSRDPVETGLRHLARGDVLVRDRFGDRGQRHQGRLGAHLAALAVCTTTKVEGSRSNGSVPATAAKPSKAGPMELAMRAATSASTGTPATSAIALISFGVGLVVRHLLLARRAAVAPNPVWPFL